MAKKPAGALVEPANIYQVAKMYHKAAGRLHRAWQEDLEVGQATGLTLIPQMMLRAFAAELYMKAAYAAENGGRQAWGHDLKALFENLSPSFRDVVHQQWQVAVDADKLVQQVKYKFPKADFDLNTNLTSSRHVFEQLRYAHEGMPNSFLLGNLPVALNRALVSLHPEWDRPVSAVPIPLASYPLDGPATSGGRTEEADQV